MHKRGKNGSAENNGGNSGSHDMRDIIVINSADLARSYHTFRIPTLNWIFTSLNRLKMLRLRCD